MNFAASTGLAVAFLGAWTAWQSAPAEPPDGEALARALELAILSIEPAADVDADVLSEVADLAGLEPAQLEGARIYRYEPRGGERAVGILGYLPFDDPLVGRSACIVAMTKRHEFVAGTIVDDSLAPVPEWEYFFDQLPFKRAPDLEGALPQDEIDVLEEELAAGDDPESLLSLAQMRLVRLMQRQAAAFNLPSVRNRPATAAELEASSELWREVATLRDDLALLLGNAGDRFVEIAAGSASLHERMAARARAGDPPERSLREQLFQHCTACHDLPLEDGSKLHDAAEERRLREGIGDGWFRVGYDLRLRHDDLERAQQAADRMWAAALLVSAQL